MSLSNLKYNELEERCPDFLLTTIHGDVTRPHSLYEELLEHRDELNNGDYACLLRKLLLISTTGVEKEMLLEMLKGVSREDIMYDEELDAWESLDDEVTLYRGTMIGENPPRLSWTLDRDIAEGSDFFKGELLMTRINKHSIIAYFSKSPEEEILVDVKRSDCQVIKIDEHCSRDVLEYAKNLLAE